MIVSAYKDIAGADICMYPTVADIFSFRATLMREMGKKKKLILEVGVIVKGMQRKDKVMVQ